MSKKEISYSEAVAEIEQILQEMEHGEPEVDELTEKVKRVSFLIKLCKSKLKATEQAVEKILKEDLNEENDPLF